MSGNRRTPATKYQQQLRGPSSSGSTRKVFGQETRNGGDRYGNNSRSADRRKQVEEGDVIDSKFGFDRFKQGGPRLGWLLNYLAITLPDENGVDRTGLDMYFLDRTGESFKATLYYRPYFYIDVSDTKRLAEVAQTLEKRFEGCSVAQTEKEDLDMANHLSGRKHKFLQISFRTVDELIRTKSELRSRIEENKRRQEKYDYSEDMESFGGNDMLASSDPLAYMCEMREYDVPYSVRVAIDLDLRVGAWFTVTPDSGATTCSVKWQKDILEKCDLRVLAFDIECEKAPLKFPDASKDRIYMISYMISGQGYLLINRDVVTEDVDDFEYTPLPKLPGPFVVINEPNEAALLRKFFCHIQELRPHVVVTYNGDSFDWPYVENRAKDIAGLNIYQELGMKGTSEAVMADGEYTGRCMVHLDAFKWVKRDSYLPQGNQGLKAVTKYKLGYDPVEIDPEDMLKEAQERPTYMASYSVSDAVATYYLYNIYVHNFIFSLSTIIPMGPEDVLRKGSGTLCEALLMVEAYRGNIICPNKQSDPHEQFYNGHLLESETYIGGHVECLEAGVFRADIPNKFELIPSALQHLIDNVDRDLTFVLETEHDIQRFDVTNYEDVRQAIVEKLEMLRDSPLREEKPLIYHLDVGAMYPNIILTNRLQPSAMVSAKDCAACDFNREENGCKRPMTWTWRGEYLPADASDYRGIRNQLETERVDDKMFSELPEAQQAAAVKKRLKLFSSKVYRKTKVTDVHDRVNTVCMRENAFYVNTVRAFRDRRYDYKLLTKQWKGKKNAAEKRGDVIERKAAEDKEVLMDSLQLAHKCILNSFYGYVMRKGARWRSMEMAGIVTKTGAELIKQARELVEQVGRPLELDTDGIWCILPQSFPQDFKFTTKSGSKVSISYPCAMLNADVHENYTNHQYQDLANGEGKYVSKSECSIYFELDGPYQAMVLPASPEEGKLLKKKYVVFNFDGTIAELKGFELKRRGELEMVKIFQSQVFEQFLAGSSLQESYDAVGTIANNWLDVLDNQGFEIDDEELLQLISEKKTISKTLEDYEGRKATSLTTAGRLADFLGPEMVKDKGLNCNLIISRLPPGVPVTDRAIPVAIFSAEPGVRRHYLRKWLKDPNIDTEDFRTVVDWEYYKGRLGNTIQKIVTIPAGMQGIFNPCPRVEHPVWLERRAREMSSGLKQMKLTSMFQVMQKKNDASMLANVNKSPSAKGTLLGDELMMSPAGKARVTSPGRLKDRRSPARKSPNDKKRSLHGDMLDAPSSSPSGSLRPVGDIEDMMGSGGARGTAGRPIVHQRVRKSVHFSPHPEEESSTAGDGYALENDLMREKTPSPTMDIMAEDSSPPTVNRVTPDGKLGQVALTADKIDSKETFLEWLELRKASWSKRRAERKAEKAMLAKGGAARGAGYADYLVEENGSRKKPVGVADFVRNAALAATYGFWQIIEIQQTESPGDFIVWAMTSKSQMQRLKLNVPRIMYVNCRGRASEEVAKELGGVLIKRDLPHSRNTHSLYEVSISEKKFQRNEKALISFLCDPQVEGVYETQTPLWLRAVMKMGCLARVANVDEKSQNNGYKLNDLEFVNTMTHPYLQSTSASMRILYVYAASDKSRNSGLGGLGFFVLDETMDANGDPANMLHSGKAQVWLACGSQLGDRPPLKRIYSELQPNPAASVHFTTTLTQTTSDAYRGCNEALGAYLRGRHGPTLVVVQGSLDPREWRHMMPALQEFPVAAVPSDKQDDYFPAIGWQMFFAKRLVYRYLFMPRWLNDRLQCARHAHIPLCNLGTDAPTTMIDVELARQLQHNRHLLWASHNKYPDLGGAEGDEISAWNDPLEEPVLNFPGAYRSVCVELSIYNLAVSAILKSGLLDAEGLTAINVTGKADASDLGRDIGSSMTAASMATDASCARAFNLIKAKVSEWYANAYYRGDEISESKLISLYRYLCGYGDSLLADPALLRVVYSLMSKLFKKLMAELRRSGVRIVYGDFTRVIIHTNKQSFAAAREYLQYITSTVTSEDMFSDIEIRPKHFWEQLLWLGPENWGGLNLEDDCENNAEVIDVADDDGEDADGGEGEEAVDDAAMETDGADENTDPTWKNVPSPSSMKGADALSDKDKGASSTLSSRGRSPSANNAQKIRQSAQSGGEYDFLDNLLGDEENDMLGGTNSALHQYDDDDDDDDDGNRDMYNYYDDDEDGGDDGPKEPESRLQEHWNLASFLPPTAAEYFHYIVGKFMDQYSECKYAFMQQANEARGSESTAPMVPIDEDSVNEAVISHMKTLIRTTYTDELLRVVDEIAKVYSHHVGEDRKHQKEFDSRTGASAFPKRAGSHLMLSSPALEFAKAITHILALDNDLTEEVDALKGMLLLQLRVSKFSGECDFKDPCLSYVMRDVICKYCCTCRDIDLLRDPVVANEEMDLHARWQCSNCPKRLDTAIIENRLLDEVDQLHTSFLCQDARCPKTHEVSTRITRAVSNLSVPLALDTSADHMHSKLHVLSKVAKAHKFEWLEQVVSELIT